MITHIGDIDMAKKKASKKVAPVKEVLVDGPADSEAEAVSAPAHVASPMCYSRSKSSKAMSQVSGQNQHMTVAENQKA